MALMRGNPYIYPTSAYWDGEQSVEGWEIVTPSGSVFIPNPVMEELAVMIVAKMDEGTKARAMHRSAVQHGLNFSAGEMMNMLNLASAADIVKGFISEVERRDPSSHDD